jgi:antitoxin VapB
LLAAPNGPCDRPGQKLGSDNVSPRPETRFDEARRRVADAMRGGREALPLIDGWVGVSPEGTRYSSRTHNGYPTQAVRLPADVPLPADVKRVDVRVRGQERIIAPLGHRWDSFFMGGPEATDDFMAERASQVQPGREEL